MKRKVVEGMSNGSALEISSVGGTLTITPMRAMMHGRQAWSISRTAIETITLDRYGEAYSVTLHLVDGRGFVVRGISVTDARKLAQAFGVPMGMAPAGKSGNGGVTGGPATRPLPPLPAHLDTREPYQPTSSPAQDNVAGSLPDGAASGGAELVAPCIQGRFIITAEQVALLGDNGWLVPRREVAGVMPQRGSFGCDLAVVLHSGVTRWLDGLAYPDAVGAIELLGMGGGMQLGEPAAPTWPDERHRTPSLSGLPELSNVPPAGVDAAPMERQLPPLTAFARQAPVGAATNTTAAPTWPLVERPADTPVLASEQPDVQRDNAGIPQAPEVAPPPALQWLEMLADDAPSDAPASAPPASDRGTVPLATIGPAGEPLAAAEPMRPAPDEGAATVSGGALAVPDALPLPVPEVATPDAPEIPTADASAPPDASGRATPQPISLPAESGANVVVAEPETHFPLSAAEPLGVDAPESMAEQLAPAEESRPPDAPAPVEESLATAAPTTEAPQIPPAEAAPPVPTTEPPTETPSEPGVKLDADPGARASSELDAEPPIAPAETPAITAPSETVERGMAATTAPADESDGEVGIPASMSPRTFVLARAMHAAPAPERGPSALAVATAEKSSMRGGGTDTGVAGVGGPRRRDYASMAAGAVLLIAMLFLAMKNLQPLPQVHLRTERSGAVATHAAVASPTTSQVSPTTRPNVPGASLAAVLAGSHDGTVYALSPRDGSLLWQYRTGGIMESAPALAGTTVFMGSDDHIIYALDLNTHDVRWRAHVGGNVTTPPTVSGGVVFVGGSDGYLYALDAANGATLWQFKAGSLFAGQPATSGGIVYAGSYDGNLYALRTTDGAMRWRYHTGGEVTSSPAVVGGIVYAGSNDGAVYAFDAASGVLRWRYQTGDSVSSSPTVANGTVYVGSFDSFVYALRARDGLLLWRHQTGGLVSSSPSVVDGVVYIGSADNKVYALRTQDGAQIWAFKTGDAVSSSPAVADGAVYVGSSDHAVYALSAANGSLLWSHQTRDTVNWRPAIVP